MNFIFNFITKWGESVITKWDSFNVSQGRASVLTMWGSFFCVTKRGKQYYKVGHILQSGAIITKQVSTIYLAIDNLFLRIPEKLNFCYNYKEEEITTHHRRICVTCKLEEQPRQSLSFTENCFFKFYKNFQDITHYGE